MFLRNYYNSTAIFNLGSNKQGTSTSDFGDSYLNVKTIDGTIKSALSSASFNIIRDMTIGYSFQSVTSYSLSSIAIAFGSGTTAVSYDDYTLESFIYGVAASAYVRGVPTYDSTSKKWSCSQTFVLNNTNDTSVTINEIGLISSTSTQNQYRVLMYREVLATPITIAAGESVNYTHNFEFTMPTIS